MRYAADSEPSAAALVPSPAGVVPYAALARQFHAEPRGKLYCLHGSRLVFRIALSAVAQLLLRDVPVALVDGTNRFDPYFIAEFARRVASRGGPPAAALLDRIYVSRAFTCYQMEAVITEKLPAFIGRAGVPVAVVFGPLDTFYDDQAPFFEVRAGVERMLAALHELRARKIGVLTASQDVRLASRERSRLFPRFAAAMDNVFQVTEQDGRSRILLEQRQISDIRYLKSDIAFSSRSFSHGSHRSYVHDGSPTGDRQLEQIPPRPAQRGPGGAR